MNAWMLGGKAVKHGYWWRYVGERHIDTGALFTQNNHRNTEANKIRYLQNNQLKNCCLTKAHKLNLNNRWGNPIKVKGETKGTIKKPHFPLCL